TQRTAEGPTYVSAGSRDLTHTMSPANLDRCSPGCASEKRKGYEGNDEEPRLPHWNLPCQRPVKPAPVLLRRAYPNRGLLRRPQAVVPVANSWRTPPSQPRAVDRRAIFVVAVRERP